ncbi:MAG: RNA 2',3'-cyclic phosphodiesterase [Bacillota bacterium]|nr:RNA 2',3'-cyclic phosphodiesterase [Thermoanaerobacteraceae bacterium]
MEQTLRLFWAVSLPPAVREKLAAVQDLFRGLPLDVKWVETENLHITVRFLGETGTHLVEPLTAAVAERVAETAAFTLRLGEVGVFPSVRKPRVLWVGIRNFEPLVALNRLVEEAVRSLGFPPENKPYSPHVTIGRFRTATGARALERTIAAAGPQEVGEVIVDGLELLASRLTPAGPVYTPLRRVFFGGVVGEP